MSVSRVDEEARKRTREALKREAAAQRRKLDALRAEDAAWRAALERDESARKKPSAARTLVEYRRKWDKLLARRMRRRRTNCARRISHSVRIQNDAGGGVSRFSHDGRASRRAPRETSRGVVALASR